MAYHLKKSDGAIFGPIEDSLLERWANDGRIAPDDLVSEDRASWRPVVHLDWLGMDWLVRLPDGSLYGPLNLKALEALAQMGEIEVGAEVIHRASARRSTLSMALRFREEGLGIPPRTPVNGPASAEASSDHSSAPARLAWKEIAESKDRFEHEAIRWRTLYEEERARAARHEQELGERVEEFRRNDLSSRTLLEQAERKLDALRNDYQRMQQTLSDSRGGELAARAVAWMESYQDMSRRYEELLGQLAARAEEAQALRDARDRAEEEARVRIEQAESAARREREDADRARRRLTEVENTHLHLVKAYRELNDRFVRLREQPSAPPPESAEGPRIRLNR